ncbi:MAG TPA: AraC family transcriptional regulator [Chitinophaga sp.]|uniref:helix-turn-helix transcriptional regulator n=1 Tax=Chitinophaga sp. TaxID=1869181 RepID=UPI002C7CEF81|nr:AraC family transcriptional regulator [Chitinophaga sp.]HVI44624.1 AraC family transcriptional regulator [Chitinophaga sp.]
MRILEKATYLGNTRHHYEADGVIVSEAEYREPVYEGWHCHENNHLSLTIKGGNIEKRRSGEKVVSTGNIAYYNSGEMHRNSHTLHPTKNLNIAIEDSFLLAHDLHFSMLHQYREGDPAVKFAVLNIYRECLAGDNSVKASVDALLLHTFSAPLTHQEQKAMPLWVEKVRQLLHDSWNETLSLQQISAAAGVHPVTVSRYFPYYFGCQLGEYMRKIKIDRALHLIGQPDMSLTDVALYCGFFDQSHFIRTFRSCTGFLPRAYRKL